MSEPFSFFLTWSPTLRAAVVLLHCLPIAAGLASGLALPIMLVLGIALAFSAVAQIRRARADAAKRLTLAPGACRLEQGEGEEEIEIQPEFTDLGWLIAFSWQASETGRRGRAVIVRDAFGADEWRRIRCFLRWDTR